MKKISFIGLALAATLLSTNANAQKYGATPEDSVQCVQNLSIYREFYKQKEYLNAYTSWKEVINNCPKKYLQEVPKYSAIHVNGKRLYDYARNNVDVVLPKR